MLIPLTRYRVLQTKCVNHGEETEIWDVGDFGRLVGDGGCRRPCGVAMPCGHTCPRCVDGCAARRAGS